MQFSSIFTSLALAASVLADSESFGLLLIRSGSNYQYSTIGLVDNTFEIASSDYITATITDEGLLSIGDGKYAVVSDSGITAGTEGSASFSIVDGYLEYNGAGFSLTADYALLAGGSGPNPVAVRPTLADGSTAADFTPSSGSSDESSASTSSEETETSSTFVVQTDNGVAKIGASVGAVAFAAAVLI